jgi:hypothetical protein
MNNIVYILYLVILVWSIYDIWTGTLEQGKKILWTIVCILFGLIGTLIYVLAARKK